MFLDGICIEEESLSIGYILYLLFQHQTDVSLYVLFKSIDHVKLTLLFFASFFFVFFSLWTLEI